MIDVVRVHQLPRLIATPDDIRTASLRSIIQSAPRRVVVQDAQTGQRYIPTIEGLEIRLTPCPEDEPATSDGDRAAG